MCMVLRGSLRLSLSQQRALVRTVICAVYFNDLTLQRPYNDVLAHSVDLVHKLLSFIHDSSQSCFYLGSIT